MPALIFKVITQKPVELNFTEKAMLQFPVHEHYLIEGQEIVMIYKFKPTKKTEQNLDAYIEYLLGYLKRAYNAYSVTYGGLQEQLKEKTTN